MEKSATLSARQATIPDWLRARFSDGHRFLILCVVVGLLCGLAAVAFHWSIQGLFSLVWATARWLGGWQFAAFMILAPTLAGLFVGWALRAHPEASGSGIPQTKAAYFNRFGVIRLRDGFWRFVLVSVFVGMGNSLGREGPTIHICASIASKIGQWAFRAKERIQSMVPVGMAAGIAAAFNAPLSAITFVFEDLLDDFSTKALGGVVVSVVIAASVSRMLLGHEPILGVNFPDDFTTAPWMLIAVPLGLAAGLLGHAFVEGLLRTRAFCQEKLVLPMWLQPAVGGVLVGLLGIGVWFWSGSLDEPENGIFSIGYESLGRAFQAEMVVGVLLLLLVGKFLAVIISYASGGSGGLFSPTLFIGGMLGGLAGLGLVWLDGGSHWLVVAETEKTIGACVLLGMGAFFASVRRCPLTSLLILFEMTQSYSLMLPLMVGNMLSFYLARRLRPISLNNALMMQDGITLRRMPSYQGMRDYRNLPVSAIMTHNVLPVSALRSARECLDWLEERGRRFHGYPVVDAEGRLAAMVMHHELLEADDPEEPIGEWLAGRPLYVVGNGSSVQDAVQLMIQKDVQQLPVVLDGELSRLVGMVTLNDIARQQNAVEISS
ncbi:MAG: chloride channel protein [Verrucomicrobiota bacterium]